MDNALLDAVKFNSDGLVAAIAQDADSGRVLMMAWMNRQALQLTIAEQRAVYYSRSRRALWRKGESSGQVQTLVDLRLDCDGDTILLLVDQKGVACHTGRRNCFFLAARAGEWETIAEVETNPDDLYGNKD